MIFRWCFCFLIAYIALIHNANAQILPEICAVDGERLVLQLDRETVASTPPWSPNDSDEPPPISVFRAIKLAKERLAQVFPAKRDTEWRISVRLGSVCVDPLAFSLKEVRYPPTLRYVYTVRFMHTIYDPSPKREKLPDGSEQIHVIDESKSSDLSIAVLLDGTVIHPEPSKSKKAIDEPGDEPKSR